MVGLVAEVVSFASAIPFMLLVIVLFLITDRTGPFWAMSCMPFVLFEMRLFWMMVPPSERSSIPVVYPEM